jgi:hypothetical protein
MEQIFPYANIVAGVLILLVGFGIHWIGQLICLVNRDLAMRLGFLEKGLPPEFEVYEMGIAAADVALGWIYGLAGIGLILNTSWSYKLAWFPGVVMIYHALSFWFWSGNQKKMGFQSQVTRNPGRIIWFLANMISGVLAVLVAWNSS